MLDVTLGPWLLDSNHHTNKWWLDSNYNSLFQHNNNTWMTFPAKHLGRIRYCVGNLESPPPMRTSHRVEISTRTRYLEVTSKTKIEARKEHNEHIHHYSLEIRSAFLALPHHIQRLTDFIPAIKEPMGYLADEPRYIRV
jgi:hypothetical protein